MELANICKRHNLMTELTLGTYTTTIKCEPYVSRVNSQTLIAFKRSSYNLRSLAKVSRKLSAH
jgi:hypothetical protein